MNNGSDTSNPSSTRLPSAGDALRRVSSTNKFNQSNPERINVQTAKFYSK
jgi:hypothetical protein